MTSRSQPIWASQPFKALYITVFILKFPLSLVYYIAKFNLLNKSFRPNPNLSPASNVGIRLFKSIFQLQADTRIPAILTPELSASGKNCIDVSVPNKDLFTGILDSETIRPVPLQALWSPSPPPSDPTQIKTIRTVLHFPGGAFVIKMNHNLLLPNLEKTMKDIMKADRTIWAQYRLADSPSNSFPAAIQDAVSFYAYVLSTGIDPKNIVISGDSAGGNVALALLRYLEDTKVMPLPSACIAISPWVNVTENAGVYYTASRYSDSDLLNCDLLQWGADAYRHSRPQSKTEEAYISPLHHPFKTSVPLLLHAGGAEAFCGDIEEFAKQMIQLNGTDKTMLAVIPDTTHAIAALPGNQGKSEEVAKSLIQACEMFERQ